MCYFDKTGTLTSDRLNLLGVATCGRQQQQPAEDAPNASDEDDFLPPNAIPADAGAVMATCHELVWVNGKVGAGNSSDAQLVGNQMELIALQKSGWNFSATGVVTPPRWLRNEVRSLKPVHCFPFESANRRMTVVCKNEGSRQLRWARRGGVRRRVFMKGAPEMVAQFLAWKDLPESVTEKDVRACEAVKCS